MLTDKFGAKERKLFNEWTKQSC